MTAADGTKAQPCDAPVKTLGDLLYADEAKPRVPEEEWAALVHSVAAGDQVALHALYERTHRIVFVLIMRIIRNREMAEELMLDVFHDVWRRAPAYDPADGSVVGWIMNQARSRSIDRLRFEQRKKRRRPEAEGAQVELNGVQEEGVELEERSLLHGALGVLSLDERTAIETAFFAGLTYAEVAASLNVPVGTVKTRIRSGLVKLRQALCTGDESL